MCLNGLSSVDWRVADFFQPLEAGTFDVVLCNPPFIISPRTDALHSDSGQPVDQLCRSLVRAAPGWLSPGGYFQMPFNWAQRRDEDWRENLAGWCQGISCDALLMYSHLQDAAEYALDRLQETVEDTAERTAEFDRWMVYYQEQKIEAIGFGVMTLRRTEARTPWFHHHQFRAGEQPDNGTIRQAFARRDFFRTHPTDTLLLEARLRRASRLMRQQKHTHSDKGWALIESRLGLLDGPSPTAVPAEVVKLIEWCDGKTPIGKYLTRTSPDGKAPQTAEFAATVRPARGTRIARTGVGLMVGGEHIAWPNREDRAGMASCSVRVPVGVLGLFQDITQRLNAANDHRRRGRVRVARLAPRVLRVFRASPSRVFSSAGRLAGCRSTSLSREFDVGSSSVTLVGSAVNRGDTSPPHPGPLPPRQRSQPCRSRRLLDANGPGEWGKETVRGYPQFRT